jgi:hypothetical protein
MSVSWSLFVLVNVVLMDSDGMVCVSDLFRATDCRVTRRAGPPRADCEMRGQRRPSPTDDPRNRRVVVTLTCT